jgi:hypothetical protein
MYINRHSLWLVLIVDEYFYLSFVLEIFYGGESIARRTIVSLTCSHCAVSGFIPRTLLTHCVEKHSTQTKTAQAVVCKTFLFSRIKFL